MTEAILTATATAVGGRDGHVESSDGVLKFDVAMPGTPRAKELPNATNPEQLFAAGYSACFDSALQLVARKARVKFDSEVTANVCLLKDETDSGFKLAVTILVKGTGIDREQLEHLAYEAHRVCPYSKATRDNIEVAVEVIE